MECVHHKPVNGIVVLVIEVWAGIWEKGTSEGKATEQDAASGRKP